MDQVLGDLIPLVAIVCSFGIPAAVIIIIAILRHNQRMELVRQGINPDAGLPPYPKQTGLFAGLLLLGVGLAMIALVIMGSESHFITPGILLIGAGIAYLVYWKLTAADREKVKKLFEERWASGSFDQQLGTPKGHSAAAPVTRSESSDTKV
jgi:hypothetical protein